MKKIILVFVFSVFVMSFSNGAVCIALASGDWETSATWSCGHVPTCGDSIIIPKTITVTITTVESYGCGTPMQVVIYGTLSFVTGKKLEMPCGSALYLEPGGTIDPGGGGGSSNLISICSTNYWTAGEGPITGPQCFNCVLPIRLITFNATCTGNNIVLNWATATETNNHYFTIERSDDGYSWIEMGTINGAGTTSGPHYYTWTDADPLPGISYYQLKQTDYDGQSSYAGVIASSCNGTGVLNLYPNPGQGNIYCRIRSNNAQTVSFKIIDELGRNIVSYADNVAKGVTDEPLPTAKLQAGVYLLVIEFSDGTSSVHKSFIISR